MALSMHQAEAQILGLKEMDNKPGCTAPKELWGFGWREAKHVLCDLNLTGVHSKAQGRVMECRWDVSLERVAVACGPLDTISVAMGRCNPSFGSCLLRLW